MAVAVACRLRVPFGVFSSISLLSMAKNINFPGLLNAPFRTTFDTTASALMLSEFQV